MKWLRKLGNPLLLVIHGFVAGAILFAATNPGFAQSRSERGSAEALFQTLVR